MNGLRYRGHSVSVRWDPSDFAVEADGLRVWRSAGSERADVPLPQ